MFTELLDRVLLETPGAIAVTLMGFDGIAIESRSAADASLHQVAVIEFGNIANQLRRVSDSLGAAGLNEVTIQTGQFTTLMRALTDEYFLALSLTPDGIPGKGRYLMRVVAPKLCAEL